MVRSKHNFPQPSHCLCPIPDVDLQKILYCYSIKLLSTGQWSFWLLPVRSPLLGELHVCLYSSAYWDVSLQQVTDCLATTLVRVRHYSNRVSPFRNVGLYRFNAPYPTLSQHYTSFVGIYTQGIHCILLMIQTFTNFWYDIKTLINNYLLTN